MSKKDFFQRSLKIFHLSDFRHFTNVLSIYLSRYVSIATNMSIFHWERSYSIVGYVRTSIDKVIDANVPA